VDYNHVICQTNDANEAASSDDGNEQQQDEVDRPFRSVNEIFCVHVDDKSSIEMPTCVLESSSELYKFLYSCNGQARFGGRDKESMTAFICDQTKSQKTTDGVLNEILLNLLEQVCVCVCVCARARARELPSEMGRPGWAAVVEDNVITLPAHEIYRRSTDKGCSSSCSIADH
jgi:hypothetical protein